MLPPVDHGNAAIPLDEMLPVVGGVQLASERDLPPVGTSKLRRRERRGGHDLEVPRRPDLGDDELLAAQALEEGAAQWHDEGIAADVRQPIEGLGATQPEPSGNLRRRTAGARGHEQEPETAMDRKQTLAVLEAVEGVHQCPIEERPAQRRAAMIGGEATGQDQPEPAARPDQRQRALDEELIQVDVTVALQPIDAGASCEVGDAGSRQPRVNARARGTVVSPEHLPGRVADDRVEPGSRQRPAARIVEDLGKLEGPVEEPVLGGDARRLSSSSRLTVRSGSADRPVSTASTSVRNAAASAALLSTSRNQPEHQMSASRFHRLSVESSCSRCASARSFART